MVMLLLQAKPELRLSLPYSPEVICLPGKKTIKKIGLATLAAPYCTIRQDGSTHSQFLFF